MEKILLIDDLEDNLIALNAIINDEFPEMNVITAHDGATGIELARIHNPNVIMLDILMPRLDGFEVCRILKNDVVTGDIPVVFVTALKENRENKIRALQAGAEGFLAKPVDNIELVALVKTMLKIKAANISLKEDKKLLEQIVYARTIELKESEEKHRALYENAPLPFQSLNEDGSFRDVNPAWLNTLGYKREEVIGKFYIDFLHPDYRAHFEKNFPAFKKRGYVHDVQFKIRHKDGHYIDISFEGCVGYYPDGRFKQTYCVFQDITERKLAEAKLIQSEEKYRMFIDLAVDAFFQGDANGDFIEVNNSAVELTGYSRQELLGMNMKDLFSEDFLIKKPLQYELLFKGETITTEREVIRKDGGRVFVEMSSKKQTDGTFQSFFKDITSRKQALDALKESEERFTLAMNASSDGLFDWNLVTNKIYYSPGWKKMLGYFDHELPNDFSIWENLTEAEDVRKSWELQQKLIAGEIDRFVMEFKMKHKQGHWVDILSQAKAIFDESGKAVRIVGTHKDITQRRLAEEKIREKDIQFRKLSANVPDLIFQFTRKPDGSYFVPIASEGIKNIFGCSPEDVLDDFTPIASVIYPEDAERVIADIEYSAEHLTYFTCEFRVLIPGREIQWILSKSTPEKLPDGSITWYGFNVDITERKKAEIELKESELRYRNVIDISPDGIIIHSDGIIKMVNQAAARLIGASSPDDLVGKPAIDFIHPSDRQFVTERIIEMLKTGVPAPLHEERIIHMDGLEFFVETAAVRTTFKGKLASLVVMRDISERKLAEKALHESEIELKRAQQMSHVGSFHIDLVTNQVIWSEELFKMYGFDPAFPPPLLDDSQKLFTHESWELLSASIAEAATNGTPYEIELKTIRKDGSNGWMWARGEAIREIDNKIVGISGAVQDITERKILEEGLKDAKMKAIESDRLKSAFLANMSHEIRTPMNGILGFAGLLKEPKLTGEEQKKYIQIIEKAGARMLNIINDIVDISKIEAGLMRTEIKESNINDQIEYIHTFFKPEMDTKGLRFSFNNSLPRNKAFIKTDREKLFAILTNLVKNAIKYTPNGAIEMGYVLKGKFLVFHVKDTGIGIKPDRQEAIFERFIQADIEDKMARQGAGLGLSISKAYLEMMGGRIWVESAEGVGSTFYFTLPYNTMKTEQAIESKEAQTDLSVPQAKKLKVLIVEDDETSGLLLTTALEKNAKEMILVTNGEEAIQSCRTHSDIDLVLMDIQLPVLNGYEATRQIRQFNKNIVIIAQTAFALSGDNEKAIAAGCNDYITKPIGKDKLMILIQKHFG